MKRIKTYHAKEFAPGKWHVMEKEGGITVPLYDDDGDKPLVFDEDHAFRCVRQMNGDTP